jgi:hypothetical protein
MKAVTQSGLVIFGAVQTTSFLQTAVIVGLEMLYADTAKMWQSPAVSVSSYCNFSDDIINKSQYQCSIKPYNN